MGEKIGESEKAGPSCMVRSWPAVGPLPALISETQACVLRPLEFFVAWQGVLTIAYSGFPPSLYKVLEPSLSLYFKFALRNFCSSPWIRSGFIASRIRMKEFLHFGLQFDWCRSGIVSSLPNLQMGCSGIAVPHLHQLNWSQRWLFYVTAIAVLPWDEDSFKLKKEIHFEFSGMMKENPGSIWPKTSVGCLKDSKFLSMSQLVQLREICREESSRFSEEHAVVVDNLSVVVYQNCCLEKALVVTEVPLKCPVDTSEPLPSEGLYVRSVLNAFAEDNLPGYYPQVVREGNRTAHYRDPKLGSTVVHFLQKPPPLLARFKERVEAAMPGMYDWFSNDSLHVTVRALL